MAARGRRMNESFVVDGDADVQFLVREMHEDQIALMHLAASDRLADAELLQRGARHGNIRAPAPHTRPVRCSRTRPARRRPNRYGWPSMDLAKSTMTIRGSGGRATSDEFCASDAVGAPTPGCRGAAVSSGALAHAASKIDRAAARAALIKPEWWPRPRRRCRLPSARSLRTTVPRSAVCPGISLALR